MNGKNAKREKQHSPSALQESPAIHTRAEEKQVEERLAIGPHIVYETIRREGEEGVQAVFASTGMVRIRGGTFQRIFTGSGGRWRRICPRRYGRHDFKTAVQVTGYAAVRDALRA
jgi:hypothetical protein